MEQVKYEDQILYHYTSLEVLKNILENRTIRLTDYRFLNDPKELKFGINIFKNAIPKDATDYHFKIVSKALENLELGITNCLKIENDVIIPAVTPNRTNFYILSMTDKRDDLALWNAYGKNGCCIKFNHQALFSYFRNIINLQWKSGIFNYCREKVHYGLCSDIELAYFFEDFKCQGKSLEANIDYQIRQLCSLYKDEAYKYESEYRIGVNYIDNFIDGKLARKQFTVKDGFIKPQIEFSNFTVEEIIEEIIISPYNNFDCSVLGVQELVNWFVKKDIPIQKSSMKIR